MPPFEFSTWNICIHSCLALWLSSKFVWFIHTIVSSCSFFFTIVFIYLFIYFAVWFICLSVSMLQFIQYTVDSHLSSFQFGLTQCEWNHLVNLSFMELTDMLGLIHHLFRVSISPTSSFFSPLCTFLDYFLSFLFFLLLV